MTPGIRPLVAGNWKMNGTSASLNELRMIGNGFMSGLDAETEALVCVPATLLAHAAEILSRTPGRAGLDIQEDAQRLPRSGPAERIAIPRKAAPIPGAFRPRC